MPSSDTADQAGQLSLTIKPHPDLAHRAKHGDPIWLTGTIAGKLELPVNEDLNAGDQLIVTIAGTDGAILARGYLEVQDVHPKPIRDQELGVIGTERKHNVKVVEVDRDL